jgi:hypothetical protein
MPLSTMSLLRPLVILFLFFGPTIHAVPLLWKSVPKSPQSSSRAPVPHNRDGKSIASKQKRQLVVQEVKQTVKTFATDAGIWTALAFIGGDYLCRQKGPVGVIAATIGKILPGMTKFPGVAFTLCFLSIPVPNGRNFEGWTMFCKSYVVYMFRYLCIDTATKFWPYAIEGGIGILTAIKLLHHIM